MKFFKFLLGIWILLCMMYTCSDMVKEDGHSAGTIYFVTIIFMSLPIWMMYSAVKSDIDKEED